MKEVSLKRLHASDSNWATFWERQNYGDRKMSGRQRLRGVGRAEPAERSTQGVQGSEATLHGAMMTGICHENVSSRTHSATPRVNPDGNHVF